MEACLFMIIVLKDVSKYMINVGEGHYEEHITDNVYV
jgi:hypothetical protein